MARMDPDVDKVFEAATTWRAERVALRAILLASGLTEELKWGKACYSFNGGNVAMFYGLKAMCGIGSFKGSLLSDREGVLIRQGKNSQAVRLMGFTSVQEINAGEANLRAYLAEAIDLEKAGRKVDFSQKDNLEFPDELQSAFDADPGFEAAFKALTPGRQRGYVLHFDDAKQSKTRDARIAKHKARILAGKGMQDR